MAKEKLLNVEVLRGAKGRLSDHCLTVHKLRLKMKLGGRGGDMYRREIMREAERIKKGVK